MIQLDSPNAKELITTLYNQYVIPALKRGKAKDVYSFKECSEIHDILMIVDKTLSEFTATEETRITLIQQTQKLTPYINQANLAGGFHMKETNQILNALNTLSTMELKIKDSGHLALASNSLSPKP